MKCPRVHLFLSSSENPYQRLQAEAATAVARRSGAILDIEFAAGDGSTQAEQILTVCGQATRPDIVLVMPVQEAPLAAVSEDAVRAGIGWVFLNRSAGNVSALRRANPRLPVGFVTPDQEDIGRLQARIVRGLFPSGAQALYVHGTAATSSARARRAGFAEALQAPGAAVDVVGTLDGNWTASDCEAVVMAWLETAIPACDGCDVIVCQSDFMATGALKALHAASVRLGNPAIRRVAVVGCDGLAGVGRALVDQRRLAATVIVPTSADKALATAVQAWRAGTPMPEKVLLTPRAYPDEAVLGQHSRQSLTA